MRYLIIRVKVHTPLTPMSDMISKVVSCLTMASLPCFHMFLCSVLLIAQAL